MHHTVLVVYLLKQLIRSLWKLSQTVNWQILFETKLVFFSYSQPFVSLIFASAVIYVSFACVV